MKDELDMGRAKSARLATWWLVLAACWLQAIVMVCIVQEISHTQSPISQWYGRVLRVLGLS